MDRVKKNTHIRAYGLQIIQLFIFLTNNMIQVSMEVTLRMSILERKNSTKIKWILKNYDKTFNLESKA